MKLFASVAPPAIDVSGTPTLRGGGGCGYSEAGWYAVAVCICRLADCRYGVDEEKARRHCEHWRGVLEGVASRRSVEEERANVAVVRDKDIFVARKIPGCCYRKKVDCVCREGEGRVMGAGHQIRECDVIRGRSRHKAQLPSMSS